MSFWNRVDCLDARTAMWIRKKFTNYTKVLNFQVAFSLTLLNILINIRRTASPSSYGKFLEMQILEPLLNLKFLEQVH